MPPKENTAKQIAANTPPNPSGMNPPCSVRLEVPTASTPGTAPTMSATPSKMKTTIATTLIIENQYSLDPYRCTENRFSPMMNSEHRTVPAHSGSCGNQNCRYVAEAVTSAPTAISTVTAKFQRVTYPPSGPRYDAATVPCPPGTGCTDTISASAHTTVSAINPAIIYAKTVAGPAKLITEPEPKNRPVPSAPESPIMETCADVSPRLSCVCACGGVWPAGIVVPAGAPAEFSLCAMDTSLPAFSRIFRVRSLLGTAHAACNVSRWSPSKVSFSFASTTTVVPSSTSPARIMRAS
ncbi:Uncharacterised protein [Arcanobacterium haemolyticum]|nr:Uncharacterised protein [Arcanobacterium haemolyticum]